MNWIRNNLGFILIVVGIVAFVIFNIFQPVSVSNESTSMVDLDDQSETIKVEIKGEIHSPGIYNCFPDDRVVDLINQAGGLTVYADIDHINRSEKLYDEMVIQIPRKQMSDDQAGGMIKYIQVEIEGEVLQPGVYKIQEHAILNDLINQAGGFTIDANRQSLNLARKLEDGMSYLVESVSENFIYVEIRGAVNYPGVYQMEVGDMVINLINQSGGLSDFADMSDISLAEELENHETIEIPKIPSYNMSMAVDIKGGIKHPGVYYVSAGDRIIDVVYQAGGFIKNADVSNINLSTLVEDQQVIIIPTIVEASSIVVDMKGEVKYPGVYYLEEGSRLIDAIQLAGGFRPDADTSNINLAKQLTDQEMVVIPTLNDEIDYIYVEIKGEVILPGVYAMKPGERVIMLVHRAGGFTNDANDENIQLTRTLIDEEIIVVPSHSEKLIYVSVVGEVYLPGNYAVTELMSLEEIIYLAGGLTNNADINQIDFNQDIIQGAIIDIPSINDEIPTLPNEINGLININQATTQQLQTLNGIGIILSERIIEYRIEHGPFETIEDLMNVSGIGESIYASIKDDITV